MSDELEKPTEGTALVKSEVERLKEELTIRDKTIQALQNRLRLAQQDSHHLQSVVGRSMNDNAANNRRNLPPNYRHLKDLPHIQAEMRLCDAAMKFAPYVEFHPHQDQDERFEFHLAVRRLLEVRLGISIPLVPEPLVPEEAGKVSYQTRLQNHQTWARARE